jgi:hypothetical protein
MSWWHRNGAPAIFVAGCAAVGALMGWILSNLGRC